jgi:hypothetical protein
MTTPEDAGVPERVRRPRPTRPRGAGWAITLGALLLMLAATLGWRLTRDVTQFGIGAAIGSATPTPTSAPASPAMPGVRVFDGGLPSAVSVPVVHLSIPAVGLDAVVKPVGLDRATGEIAIPSSVDRLGWYRFGPDLASSAGSVVITGHVDSADQGKGEFFRLRDVKAGARVTVAGADGRTRPFIVVAREVFAKTALPLDRIFARDGPVRLTLITCGGRFDPKNLRYEDNVVLTAVPA